MSFKRTFTRWAFVTLSALITLLIISGLGYLYMEAFLPDVSGLRDAELQVPLKIYTQDGNLLAEFGQMQRVPLSYDKIPPLLIDAVVATEDQHFFEHHGIDFSGLARAALELALTGTKSQGGSTVTMQVARNFYLSRKKTFGRKFNEILLALKIDRELPKEKIMELYLNKIYLGKRAYGVEAAARVYFGKPLNQLSLPELAVIAGLPKAPSAINPITDPIAAKARRDHVLERMMVEGFIDKNTYAQAVAAPLEVAPRLIDTATNAPYAAEMVRNLMEESYGSDAYTQGYKVYTTINSQLQDDANKAIRTGVLAYDKRHGFRGAEQNLGAYHKQAWEDALAAIDSVNGLVPVVVTDVSDKTVSVMDANGQAMQLTWPNWTKKKKASDVLKRGDVVRMEQQDGKWVFSQLPKAQAALVSLDPNNGAIRALVGGFAFFDSNFNRVTQATRQPGSSFKPFIYAAAFNKGYTLASVFDDAPISIRNPWTGELWEPGNDDGKFLGPMRLRYALAMSRNTISVRLLQALGMKYTLDYMKNFGFDPSKLPNNLTLALGTPELTPLQLAAGYCVFANGGYQVSPYIIDRVEDRKGQVIYQANPKVVCDTCSANTASSDAEPVKTPGVDDDIGMPSNQAAGDKPAAPTNIAPRVITPQVAFLITQGLQQVVQTGTGAAVKSLGRSDLAGKTGTTNDYVDAWFSGFNSDLETTVWVGFDQPQPLHEYGSKVAVPIWTDYMGAALAGKPEHTMAMPPGIVSIKIDPQTGAPVGALGNGVPEFFDENHLPQGSDNVPLSPAPGEDIPAGIHPVDQAPAKEVVAPNTGITPVLPPPVLGAAPAAPSSTSGTPSASAPPAPAPASDQEQHLF